MAISGKASTFLWVPLRLKPADLLDPTDFNLRENDDRGEEIGTSVLTVKAEATTILNDRKQQKTAGAASAGRETQRRALSCPFRSPLIVPPMRKVKYRQFNLNQHVSCQQHSG